MNWADQEYAIGRGIAAIRHRQESALQPFVRGVIELELLELLAQATGSTFPNVSAFQLATIPYPRLGKAEQRTIAHILGTLDDKIELNRQMNQTLEETARALFKSWFLDFDPVHAKATLNNHAATRPQGGSDWSVERARAYLDNMDSNTAALFPDSFVDSELGPIPVGWEVTPLGKVIEIYDSCRVPLNSRQRAERQGSYPYYGAAGVMDYVDGFLFNGVHVLVGEDGSVVDANGHPVVQYVWGRFWVNNHAHVLRGRNGMGEEQLFLLLQQAKIVAFVTGAVQPKLSQRNLKAVPVVFPGWSVCGAFSDLIGPLFELVSETVLTSVNLCQP